jgi:penicillin V acylase-like amidase (Ntn superfamily)
MKRSKGIVLLVLSLIVLTSAIQLYACSGVYFNYKDKNFIEARTLDYLYGDGDIAVYPRNLEKSSQAFTENEKPFTWTSKYGSVSFNLKVKNKEPKKSDYDGCIFGMNEAGLTSGAYAILSSKAEPADSRPVLDSLSLSQYILDNFNNVNDVVKDLNSGKYRVIAPVEKLVGNVPLHLLIHDAKGHSLIIEFTAKGPKTILNPSVHVITNTPYEEDAAAINNYTGFGGKKVLPGDIDSTSRFVRGAYYLKQLLDALNNPKVDKAIIPKTDSEIASYGFDIIQTVIQPVGTAFGPFNNFTQWTMVANLTNKELYFRTFNNANVSYINGYY